MQFGRMDSGSNPMTGGSASVRPGIANADTYRPQAQAAPAATPNYSAPSTFSYGSGVTQGNWGPPTTQGDWGQPATQGNWGPPPTQGNWNSPPPATTTTDYSSAADQAKASMPNYGNAPTNDIALNALLNQTQGQQAYFESLSGLAGRGLGVANQGDQIYHDRNRALQDLITNNYGRDKGFLDRWLGLQGQLTDQQKQLLGINYGANQRGVNNEYTARGAWMAPERGLKQTDLTNTYNTNMAQEDTQYGLQQLQYDQNLAALGDKNAQARIDSGYYDKLLQNRLSANQLDYDKSTLQYSQSAQNAMDQAMQAALQPGGPLTNVSQDATFRFLTAMGLSPEQAAQYLFQAAGAQ